MYDPNQTPNRHGVVTKLARGASILKTEVGGEQITWHAGMLELSIQFRLAIVWRR